MPNAATRRAAAPTSQPLPVSLAVEALQKYSALEMPNHAALRAPRVPYVHTPRFIAEYEAICQAIGAIGEMREPELAAATGLNEDKIHRACREAVQLGWLNRRAEDGEISINNALA